MRIIKNIFQSPKKKQSTKEIFTQIFKKNQWQGIQSISGRGSDDDQTKTIINDIPKILNMLSISSMLDIPCGDFNWMKNVDLRGINYIGADIVDQLIDNNIKKYATQNTTFIKLDLLSDPLPRADIILCRDCLVHFSFRDALRALNNIYTSGSKYLLTTNFSDLSENRDITTGQWRPLNFEKPPFSFPNPKLKIIENCTEANGNYKDKSLTLWEVADISTMIA